MTSEIVLQRNPGEPWGFRLQGGLEFGKPFMIQTVGMNTSMHEKSNDSLLTND